MKSKVILLVLISLLFGCSSTTNTNKDFTYLLFASPLINHPVWLQAKAGFMDACNENAYQCDWVGPSSIDVAEMNDAVESGILQRADAIITQGVVDESLINKAEALGIPVILVDSDLANSNRSLYIGKDFNAQAELLLCDIERQWGKDKKLTISIQVAQDKFDYTQKQIAEVEKVFKKHPGGFEIVAVTSSESDVIIAKNEWKKTFDLHPDINIAINFAGESATPCYEIAKKLQIRDNLLIYGVDDLDATLEAIKEEQIDGSIITSFYDYGYKAVQYIETLKKRPKTNHNSIYPATIKMINKDTIKDYEDEKDN